MKELKRFRYALEGILNAIKTESHLRFHIVASFYVILFAYLGAFNCTQWCILFLTVAGVLVLELINTAVEEVCNLYTREYNKLVKRIKDIAAGAVLILSIGAVAVAFSLFISTGKLSVAFEKLTDNPLWFIPLGISVILSIIFIIFPFKTKNK